MVLVWLVDELWMKFFSWGFIQVIHKSFSFLQCIVIRVKYASVH